jgi:voltage-gated potassium channel
MRPFFHSDHLIKRLWDIVGDEIIRQGDPGDCMYFLTSGKADVIINGKKAGAIRKGDAFGEMSLVREKKRGATVKTVTHCSGYKLTREKFHQLLSRYPDFKQNIFTQVERIEKKNKKTV